MIEQHVITPEEYSEVCLAVTSNFLRSQPNYRHTFLFQNYLALCYFKPEDLSVRIKGVPQQDYDTFIAEFVAYILTCYRKTKQADHLKITNNVQENILYTVSLTSTGATLVEKIVEVLL